MREVTDTDTARHVRWWTTGDQAYLRRSYRVVPVAEIARIMGRTRGAIHHRARVLGLVRPRRRYGATAEEAARIRELNAVGHTDPEIAQATGLGVKAIGRYRRRHGIPSNRWGERHRLRNSRANAAARVRNGVGTFAELKATVARCRKAERGWPIDLPMPCIRILETLRDRGPLTTEEVASALGYASRESLYPSNGRPSYLPLLRRRGLIRSRPDPARAANGGVPHVHELVPGVNPGPTPGVPDRRPPYMPRVYSSGGVS